LRQSHFERIVAHELGYLYLSLHEALIFPKEKEDALCKWFSFEFLRKNIGEQPPKRFRGILRLQEKKQMRGRGLQAKIIENEFVTDSDLQILSILYEELNLPLPQFVEECKKKKILLK
jgi:hypothetical protein